MENPIFENEYIALHVESSEIPWIKIFTQKSYKELSDCDKQTKSAIYETMELVEREMIKFYNPSKINIAMFGNYVPHLHVHVMARFEEDSFFPESMWGKKQREANLSLPPLKEFLEVLLQKL